jgi:glycosyltransferase involved in cell wall biosynthesis
MKITCILQVFNEIQSGHLPEFFESNAHLFDHIVAYDDGSTDGSWEYLQKHATKVLRAEQNNFKLERSHKSKMLKVATELGAEVIVTLDADEILVVDRRELEARCEQALAQHDGIKIQFVNLWRSKNHKRVDSLFNEYMPVKIWRHQPELEAFPVTQEGLHQQLYPEYVQKIYQDSGLHIVHTGFSTPERIARKYLQYRRHGQKGFDLLRLIDERNLRLEKVANELLPQSYRGEEAPPKALSLADYLEVARVEAKKFLRPKLSVVCLIYKDVRWLKFVFEQVKKYTDLREAEFFFVANDAAPEVRQYLLENYIPHFNFEPEASQKNEYYINNVYRAYNHGAEKSRGDFVVFINSDMAMTPDWVKKLYAWYDGKNCVASRLIESGRLATGQHGLEKNFGSTVDTYQEAEFQAYARLCSEDRVVEGGLFMPFLVRRDQFLQVGGYPPGNVLRGSDYHKPVIAKHGEDLISGDVVLIDKMARIGVRHQTAFNSLVYHFQEGEKREEKALGAEVAERALVALCVESSASIVKSEFLQSLKNLPRVVLVDSQKVGGKSGEDFRKYLEQNEPQIRVLVQDIETLEAISTKAFTVGVLGGVECVGRDSARLKRSLTSFRALITSSAQRAADYPESAIDILEPSELYAYLCQCFMKLEQLEPQRVTATSSVNEFKFALEFAFRKRVLKPITGRDSFYTVAEMSVFLKRQLPQPVFQLARWFWRTAKGR